MNAAKVRAPVESILIIDDNPVLKNLLAQKWWAAFELYYIDVTRQDL